MKIIIRDGTGPGRIESLSFDLKEILSALGSRALASRWVCRNLWFVTREGQSVSELEQDSEAGQTLSGEDLSSVAHRLLQVIDGEFLAFEAGQGNPWITIRAVDSSFWEVESSDPRVVDLIRAHFEDIECVE